METEPQPQYLLDNLATRIIPTVVIIIFIICAFIVSVDSNQTTNDTYDTYTAGITKTLSDSRSIAVAIEIENTNVLNVGIGVQQDQTDETVEEVQDERQDSDIWPTSEEDWDLLYAIVRQEAGDSEKGAWAVIQSAKNRTKDKLFANLYGTNVLDQLTAKNQYTYSIDGLYKKYLNGKYSEKIINGVQHCVNGEDLHNYTSFRETGSSAASEVVGECIEYSDNTFFRQVQPIE